MNLKAQNLSKHYNFQWVFKDINFNLNTGDSLTVLGANGSGKSTLLQVIYGLIEPNSGEVLVNDSKNFIESNIFSYTSPAMLLPTEFTISELHGYYLQLNKLKIGLDDFLNRLEIEEKQWKKTIKYFSSGQLQKLKTAFCLFSESPVLLLDEPLTNMDKKGELWFESIIKEIQSQKILIFAGNTDSETKWSNETIQL